MDLLDRARGGRGGIALLAKLQVSSRRDAVRRGEELGIRG